MKRWLPFGVLLFLVIVFAAALLGGRKMDDVTSPLIGHPPPVFTAGELAHDDLPKGKAYIVNFFASWCVSCRAEQEILAQITNETGVPVYGVAYKDAPADTQKWLATHGNPFVQVGDDPQGLAAIEWGVYGVPETFVIDAQGLVRLRIAGPIHEGNVESVLAALGGGARE